MGDETMHKIERKKLYLKELEKHSFITMTDFLDTFEKEGIKSATIRRDLKELEVTGAITLTFGGINVNIGNENQVKDNVVNKNLDKKHKIALKANEFLEDGDMIYCGAGTTIEEFVTNISKTIRLLVTNSLSVLQKQ
ncbi:DeoR family transcriptional regulator, lactose phosphotransferase system repressor [Spiroplasma clarkii]|nr:DeoR family transcriptional regulator, lactose phosphotransferase system repressor [Spiroplasma clarkii]